MLKDTVHLLRLSKSGDPNIIVTSSVNGVLPYPMFGVYAMTKAALVNMVKWMN